MVGIILYFLFICSEVAHLQRVAGLGINYGQVANNLPSPEKVLTLLSNLNITKTRIYDTNPQVLAAFANSGVELIVTVPDQLVHELMDPAQALQWVETNIKPYLPTTKITGIAVGNEVFASNDADHMSNLVPSMASIHEALVHLGLHNYIHVSSANSLAILESSFPPSAGTFRSNLQGVIRPFLQFLAETGAPLWMNAYPYFSYKDGSSQIPLDYVLFNPNSGMVDPYTKLHYDNMLYAQVDALIFAAARLGFERLAVGISETGWPSRGDPQEIGATAENAAMYNGNLLKRQLMNEGTPLRPQQRLEVYLFALFNEDMKPGPTSERNYGLYQPDGTMAYNVGLTELRSISIASSVSFASSASQAELKNFGSLMCWSFLLLLASHALFRWQI